MKAAHLLLGALMAGGTSQAQAQASTQAMGPTICYECRKMPDYQYYDCWWPVAVGHIACTPGGSGCLVTDACSTALASMFVTPDGSMKNTFLAAPALAIEMARARAAQEHQLFNLTVFVGDRSSGGAEVLRNCLGLIAARVYTTSAAKQISKNTATISI